MATRGRPKGTTNAAKGIDDSTKITMRVLEGDLEAIDRAAQSMGISRSALFRMAVLKFIKDNEAK